jgi:hypothetical protein
MELVIKNYQSPHRPVIKNKSFFFFFLVFRDRVSLCSPGCPGTHSVDQAGLELRDPPASASQVLGLKACATTARLKISLKKKQKELLFTSYIYWAQTISVGVHSLQGRSSPTHHSQARELMKV